MTTAVQKSLYLGNAHLAREVLTVYDPASDSYVPYLNGVATVRLSLSPTGATTIAGTGPFPMVETTPGVSGIYYYVYEPTVVALVGAAAIIYQVVEGGAFNELKVVQPLTVVTPRPPLA
jgi:hypothetical protein